MLGSTYVRSGSISAYACFMAALDSAIKSSPLLFSVSEIKFVCFSYRKYFEVLSVTSYSLSKTFFSFIVSLVCIQVHLAGDQKMVISLIMS